MNNEIDDELSFEVDAILETDKAEAPAASANAGAATATPATPIPAEPVEPVEPAKPDTAPAPQAKRSRTGMAVAAGFAVCILASSVSAVQAWRAASMASHNNEDAATKALEARLNGIQKMLEQQRNTLDELSARPAAAASGDSSQINALATAMRANQEMNERLPSLIMQQVDSRLARVEATNRAARQAAARPASRPAAKTANASKPRPVTRPVTKTAAASARPATPLVTKQADELAQQPIRRPAGEAIRYP